MRLLYYSSLLAFSLALETEHDDWTHRRLVSLAVSCFSSLPLPLPLSLARLLSTLSLSITHARAAETWLRLSHARTRLPCEGPLHPESSELLKIPNQTRGRRKSNVRHTCRVLGMCSCNPMAPYVLFREDADGAVPRGC